MHVSSLMSRNVHACTSADTLSRVAQLLWENDIGCVPVVDDGHHVVGIVTDRDIAMAAYTQGHPLGQLPVGACMSRDVQSVRADDGIELVAEKMREHRVRRLAVVDADDRLVGIVSIADLSQRHWPRGVVIGFDDDELLSVIAAVSQPRRGREANGLDGVEGVEGVEGVDRASARPRKGAVSTSVRPTQPR